MALTIKHEYAMNCYYVRPLNCYPECMSVCVKFSILFRYIQQENSAAASKCCIG